MTWVRGEIARNMSDPEFRRAYVENAVRKRIAHQIRAMREARGWSQAELGKRMGVPQSSISRLEAPEYGKWSLQSLFDVAHAFGVVHLSVSSRLMIFWIGSNPPATYP